MDQAAADTVGEELGAEVSPHLGAWLKSRNVCLLVSSYQSGRLILIGADSRGRAVIRHERFDRAMGMAVRNGSLLLATLHQLWLFKLTRRLSPGAADAGTMIVPQAGYHTGFVNCHDVAWVGAGVPIFASSMFNCVGMVAPESSFAPLWAPAFIKDLVPEDHCHLNGLAVDGGRLRFVTALSGRSGKDAWRRDRPKEVIIDVSSKKVVVSDLWMPHSPRIRDRKIWLHESGQGSFGLIEHGKFVERLACPGYTRGLDFHEFVAALGISKPRADSIEGLPLKQRLAAKGAGPSCAVLLFDTASNSVVHSIRFLSTVRTRSTMWFSCREPAMPSWYIPLPRKRQELTSSALRESRARSGKFNPRPPHREQRGQRPN